MMKNGPNIVKHATACHMSKAHSFKDDFTAALEGNVKKEIKRNVSKLAEKFGFDEDEAILFLGREKLKVNYLGPNAKTMASITNGETGTPIIVVNDDIDSRVAAESEDTSSQFEQVTNRGSGAGGANTNLNGLPYEEMTSLETHYDIIESDNNSHTIKFYDSDEIFVTPIKKTMLFRCMRDEHDSEIPDAHGCKRPDEIYINKLSRQMFIIEKKFQNGNGSVCEKIQTAGMKRWNYRKKFPAYSVFYIYCLSPWFRDNCIAELNYLEEINVPVFWGSTDNYKTEIIEFMTRQI